MEKIIIKTKIEHKGGRTVFSFEIPPKIEAMYQEQTPEVRTSQKWEGLQFYYLPKLTENEAYKNALNKYNLVDNFCAAVIDGAVLNVAFLRTVGGKGSVEIPQVVSVAEAAEMSRRVCGFIKMYTEEFLKPYKVEGQVVLFEE